MRKFPKIGVGVIIRKGNKVLLGKRRNAHGAGTWSFPGGHLELNEEIEDCAKREVMEETGLKIKNLKRVAFTNDIFGNNLHYVTLYVLADYDSGEARVMEPDKCEIWQWFDWNKLPEPLFLPIQNLVETGFNPFQPFQQD